MPVITPRDWSSRVVGVLSRTTVPSEATQIRSVNVPPTSTPTRKVDRPLTARSTPRRAEGVGRGSVDGKAQFRERAREDDAVVTLRAADAHVLVEHVVEHGLWITVERVSPSAPTAVVVHAPFAGRDGDPVGGVFHHDLVVRAVPDHHAVG